MAHISDVVEINNLDEYANYLQNLTIFQDYSIELVNEQPKKYPFWVLEMFYLLPTDDGLTLLLHLEAKPEVGRDD